MSAVLGDILTHSCLPKPVASARKILKDRSPLPLFEGRYRGEYPEYAVFLMLRRDGREYVHLECEQHARTPEELYERLLQQNHTIGQPLAGGRMAPHSIDFTLMTVGHDQIEELVVRAFATRVRTPDGIEIDNELFQFEEANILVNGVSTGLGMVGKVVHEYGLTIAGA